MSEIVRKELSDGLVLIVEPMAGASSAAINWLVPAGAAMDPPGRQGEAAMLAELLLRGAGDLDSRSLSDAMDRLGVQRGVDGQVRHMQIQATLLGHAVDEALPLLVATVRTPRLPADAVDAVRSLCLQTLEGIKDDPQDRVMMNLRRRHLPPPYNRHGHGEADDLRSISIDHLREAWSTRAKPGGSILTIAGDVAPDAVRARLEELLGGWNGRTEQPEPTDEPERGVWHEDTQSAQVHLAIAHDAPAEPDEDSMRERLAVSVLSGGMSGRLFTEVRERRSLCYSVGARYAAGRERGYVSVYAGTTPERAQQTLDVCVSELHRMREGVTPEEFRRAVVGLKSRLVMQGESTSARAATLAADEFRIGRPRSLDEIADAVDAVTLEDLNAYLARREVGELTLASIGPVELTTPTEPIASA